MLEWDYFQQFLPLCRQKLVPWYVLIDSVDRSGARGFGILHKAPELALQCSSQKECAITEQLQQAYTAIESSKLSESLSEQQLNFIRHSFAETVI